MISHVKKTIKKLVSESNKLIFHLRTVSCFSVVKDFFICSFGAIVLYGTSFFVAPFIMRKLSPEDYGVWGLTNSFINILAPLTGFGLRQVLSIEYFNCQQPERKKKVNDIIIIYLFIGIPLFSILFNYRHIINYYVSFNKVPISFISAGLFIAFMYFFAELFYQILRYERKAFKLTVLQISIAFINFLLILIFLYTYENIIGIILAQCIVMIITIIISLYAYIQNNYQSSITILKHVQKAPHYIKYGLPFIPSMLFAWLLSSGDSWILARYSGLHDVGIYTIADTFGKLFNVLILYPWSSSYLPYILNTFAANKKNLIAIEQKNHQIMYISMFLATILITVGFILSKPLLYLLIPPTYYEAIQYIWILLMGYVFLLGSYFASSFIQFNKRRYFIAFGLCIPAMLNIILNIILIPYFQIYGCTIATLLSYISYFCITLWYNYRLQKTYVIKGD